MAKHEPITVTVRYRSGAYEVQASGKRASCTHSPQEAARRLGEKLMGGEFGDALSMKAPSDGGTTNVTRWRLCPKATTPARAELLEWLDAQASKPDADILHLLWIEDETGHCDWDAGWWNGEEWLLAESGGSVAGKVLFYASPEGPEQ